MKHRSQATYRSIAPIKEVQIVKKKAHPLASSPGTLIIPPGMTGAELQAWKDRHVDEIKEIKQSINL